MTLLAFIMGALFGAALRGKPWRVVERVERLADSLDETAAEIRRAYTGAEEVAFTMHADAREIRRALRGRP